MQLFRSLRHSGLQCINDYLVGAGDISSIKYMDWTCVYIFIVFIQACACHSICVEGVSENNHRCHSPPSTMFEARSLIAYHCSLHTFWPMSFQLFSCFWQPSHHRCPGTTDIQYSLYLYLCSGGLNSS